MSIDFRPTILEKSPDVSKNIFHPGHISCAHCLRGNQESFASLTSVLVEDKHGENVAEQHPTRNESDPSENQEPARAGGRERSIATGRLYRFCAPHRFVINCGHVFNLPPLPLAGAGITESRAWQKDLAS